MIITQEQYDAIIASGNYNDNGTVTSDGWRWQCIDDLDAQETHHLRLERVS